MDSQAHTCRQQGSPRVIKVRAIGITVGPGRTLHIKRSAVRHRRHSSNSMTSTFSCIDGTLDRILVFPYGLLNSISLSLPIATLGHPISASYSPCQAHGHIPISSHLDSGHSQGRAGLPDPSIIASSVGNKVPGLSIPHSTPLASRVMHGSDRTVMLGSTIRFGLWILRHGHPIGLGHHSRLSLRFRPWT